MNNPNEYDDDRYAKSSVEVIDAVTEMWEAGASSDDIAHEVARGLEQAGLAVKVSIEVGES